MSIEAAYLEFPENYSAGEELSASAHADNMPLNVSGCTMHTRAQSGKKFSSNLDLFVSDCVFDAFKNDR